MTFAIFGNFLHCNLVSKISWKQFELRSWFLVYWLGLADQLLNKFRKILKELRPFEIFCIFTLLARYVENYLSSAIIIGIPIGEWGVYYLNSFWANSVKV